MPLFENNFSANYEIGKVYESNSVSTSEIAKIFEFDGSVDHEIWRNEKSVSISRQCTQQNGWYEWQTSYINSEDYNNLQITSFSPGTSYGECKTYVRIYRNGTVVANLRDVSRVYTGSNFTYSNNITPITTWTSLQSGDLIGLTIGARYNPNVSGQHTSTAYLTVKLY